MAARQAALLRRTSKTLGGDIIFDGVFEGATATKPDPMAVLAGDLTRTWLPVTYAARSRREAGERRATMRFADRDAPASRR